MTQSQHSQTTQKRTAILAIDYGRVRIGLAIANADTGMAQPLGVIERINRNEDMRRLRGVLREHSVGQVVVGLPLRLDGTRSEMAEESTRFAERVRKQLGVAVEMMDERLTSWEAERLLEELQGRTIHEGSKSGHTKSRKEREKITVDAIAAAVILKEYLQQRQQTAQITTSEASN